MLDSFLKMAWKDLTSGNSAAVIAILVFLVLILIAGMKKIWDAKMRSEEEVRNERERYNMLNSQFIESRDRMIDRYSSDSAIVAKALSEVEKSISHLNGMLSKQ